MQKQTRQAGETATASRRAGRAIAAYYQTSAARRAAQDRIDAWGTLLALAAFTLLVAFKLIGGAA